MGHTTSEARVASLQQEVEDSSQELSSAAAKIDQLVRTLLLMVSGSGLSPRLSSSFSSLAVRSFLSLAIHALQATKSWMRAWDLEESLGLRLF